MGEQVITTPSGERLVVLPELNSSRCGTRSIAAKTLRPFVPSRRSLRRAMRNWSQRSRRSHSQRREQGARLAFLSRSDGTRPCFGRRPQRSLHLRDRTGKKDGSVSAMKKIAVVLGVDLDDIV